MTGSMRVLDVLRERGYVPQEYAPPPEDWFDLAVSAGVIVRAVLTPEDGCEIHLTGRAVMDPMSARFTGAPGAVFLATLDAAEHEARVMAGLALPAPEHLPRRGRRHSPGWAGKGYSGDGWAGLPTTGGYGAGRD